MSKTILIRKEINDFYEQTSEEDRLTLGLGPLEFERNKGLIQKFLPAGKCTIIDVGGGTGKYSEWLALMGHNVWLADPVQKHIRQAKKRSERLRNKFHVLHAEARKVDIPDDSADLVIMHGPLYHIMEKEERIKAILEARRIVKAGGVILGFAINYTASTLVALLQGVIHEQDVFDMCISELTTGSHYAPEKMPGILPEAYYHRPEELKSEFTETGLRNIEMFAVEGLIWLDKDFFGSRADTVKNSNLLSICRITENDMNLISFSPHMMIASYK